MIKFVGVGPGDPELMTLAAVHALEWADEIAIADSGSESAVLKIAGAHLGGKPVLRLDMPMRGGHAEWQEAHRRAADILLARLSAGVNIAYPVLGDPSLYATSSYLMRLIAPKHPCEVIPGVPAVCAAAARLGVPLAEGREPLHILPGFAGELPEGNVAVMKAGAALDELRAAAQGRGAYLARNLGMEGEYVGPLDAADIGERSYFSTVIISAAK